MRHLVLLVLVALAGTALAEEKVFKLRNGRSIQGELVEETRSAYLVQVATGTVRLAKETVASIEAAPTRKPLPKHEDLGVAARSWWWTGGPLPLPRRPRPRRPGSRASAPRSARPS
jgi:hypothetical protein